MLKIPITKPGIPSSSMGLEGTCTVWSTVRNFSDSAVLCSTLGTIHAWFNFREPPISGEGGGWTKLTSKTNFQSTEYRVHWGSQKRLRYIILRAHYYFAQYSATSTRYPLALWGTIKNALSVSTRMLTLTATICCYQKQSLVASLCQVACTV